MKMNLLRGCVAAGIASAAFVPSVSHAFDGELAFYGSISDVTCNINGVAPGDGNRKEVQLGDRIGTDTFPQVGGAVASAVFGALIADPDRVLAGLLISLGIAATLLLLAAVSSFRIQLRTDTTT